jgi:adenylate cyclase
MARHSRFLQVTISEHDRRHLAVLCADIAGYTRLMEAAEWETFARARALRVSIIDPAVVSHRGEIVKNTGDGFIAVFESPGDAARCAVELQAEIAAHEEDLPPERRIQLRIGVHWERVIYEDNDVFGSGVNIAARLQAAAPMCGVVVSAPLVDQLANLPDIVVHDLGLLVMKNVSRPVRAWSPPEEPFSCRRSSGS